MELPVCSHLLKSAGSILSPVQGSMVGTVGGTVRARTQQHLLVTADILRCTCLSVLFCIKVIVNSDLSNQKAAKIGGHGSNTSSCSRTHHLTQTCLWAMLVKWIRLTLGHYQPQETFWAMRYTIKHNTIPKPVAHSL